MSVRNIFVSTSITKKRLDKLLLKFRQNYFSLCPSPLLINYEIISGEKRGHTFKWEIVSGQDGNFIPSNKVLDISFDPLGVKTKRQLKLTIDQGLASEVVYIMSLYDDAINPVDISATSDSTYKRYNDISLSSYIIRNVDSNSKISLLPTGIKYDIVNGNLLKDIEYTNVPDGNISKVSFYSLNNIQLGEVYYPNTTVTLDGTPSYSITEIALGRNKITSKRRILDRSSSSQNKKILIVDNYVNILPSSDIFYKVKFLGDGYEVRIAYDMIDINANSSTKNSLSNSKLENREVDKSSNSCKVTGTSSSLFNIKYLNVRTGLVG